MKMKIEPYAVALAALFGLFGASAVRAELVEYSCRFTSYSSPEKGYQKADFSFRISWDSVTNEAFITGNMGAAQLIAVPFSSGITFIEQVPTGSLNVTAIHASGQAAHSRHTVIGPGDFAPSQYYGACPRT